MRSRAEGILGGLALLASAAFSQTPPTTPPAAPVPGQSDFAATGAVGTPKARRYTPGEVNRYELRVREPELGNELIAVSEHRVFLRDGIPVERVRWIRLSESLLGDLSEMALEVPSYEMSLDPRGELSLFAIKGDPLMLAMITDLHAFYFAVSPGAGIGHLARPGDTYTRPEPASNNWADGDQFLAGQSQTQVRLTMVSAGPKEVVYSADFLPPAEPALTMERPWMEPPVCGTAPNNLQFVRVQDDGFLAAWGCEKSQITSRVDPASGKLLAAFMDNEMTWSLKLCNDRDLQDCEDRPQITRHRLLDLRLLPPAPQQLSSDKIRVNPKGGLEYVWIPPGDFEMGCVPGDDECYQEEKPAHRVLLTHGFWIGRTEVPVLVYQRYAEATRQEMPEAPGNGAMPGYNDGWRNKNHPMVKVTWDEAMGFCSWSGGRLPTEAEWEYAARGGADGLKYPWGNDRSHDQANFWRTGGNDHWQYTAPVASFPPNAFGLYDMAGNVYEWVADWYSEDYYESSPAQDPAGPLRGRLRVARGGAGVINPAVLRTSTRLRGAPSARNVSIGLRCAADHLP
jgi:formylglycine-generating enzyme required for sulfatase activity